MNLTIDLGKIQDVKTTAKVQGMALSGEHKIIGALVKRLGGYVEIKQSEMNEVEGIVADSETYHLLRLWVD